MNKNVEIEQLINQVLQGGPVDPSGSKQASQPAIGADAIMGQKPEQIESLLRFLIYLVLHKEQMSPDEYNRGS